MKHSENYTGQKDTFVHATDGNATVCHGTEGQLDLVP